MTDTRKDPLNLNTIEDETPEDIQITESDRNQNQYTQAKRKSRINNAVLKFIKKRGAAFVVVSIVTALSGLAGAALPLKLFHMVENFTINSDSISGPLNKRINVLFGKKMMFNQNKNLINKVCKVRGYKCLSITMNTKKFNLFKTSIESAGGKVSAKKTIFGRYQIDEIVLKGKTINKSNIVENISKNADFRKSLSSVYSSKISKFFGSTLNKLTSKLKITKANIFKNTDINSEEAINSAIGKTASGETSTTTATASNDADAIDDPEDVIKKIKQETKVDLTKKTDAVNNTKQEIVEQIQENLAKTAANGGNTTAYSVKSTVLTAFSVLFVVDTACTYFKIFDTVAKGSQILGTQNTIRLMYTIFNGIDSVKAGDNMGAIIEAIGKRLAAPNHLGYTTSPGERYAYYGDTSGIENALNYQAEAETVDPMTGAVTYSKQTQNEMILADETTQYINGGIIPSEMLKMFAAHFSIGYNTIEETCKYVKSWQGQTILYGSAIVGAIIGFYSSGGSFSASSAFSAIFTASKSLVLAGSLAFGISRAIPKLQRLAAGVVTADNGYQLGNALASGSGAFNSESGKSKGLAALTVEEAVANEDSTKEYYAMEAKIDRETHSPLDPTNKNTFMGTLVGKALPYVTQFSNLSNSLSSISNFAISSLASIAPKAKADSKKKYSLCNDVLIRKYNLATDPFCNIIYGSTAKVEDVEEVLDYMIDNNYINDRTGEPTKKDNDYALYVKDCVERVSQIGMKEEGGTTGEQCIQGGAKTASLEKRNEYFRQYFTYKTMLDDLEDGGSSETGLDESITSPIEEDGMVITSGYGPRSEMPEAPNSSSWHAALDIANHKSDKVYAIMDGTVTRKNDSINTVEIRHSDGLVSKYIHMEKILVRTGDVVSGGQVIGYIGCAGSKQGLCSGDHLDFKILVNEVHDEAKSKYAKYKTAPKGNNASKAINPANFLTDNGVSGFKGSVNDN